MRSHPLKYPKVLFVVWFAWISCLAQPSTPSDLTQASLEDLLNLQVTSVSKKEQKLSKTGAAVYVVTQEDIQRSGATNIPDLLRMVPGVNVAQINANSWAISVRGFNDRYANKVLVLIDGRSVYSPDTSGVFWDQQNLPVEDIERIEVIRGPGGTVWGANAMNGVINIITKSATATKGGLLRAVAGSQQNGQGLVQYGGAIGSSGSYRVFGDYFNVGSLAAPNGGSGADDWHSSTAGFRSDWEPSSRDTLTVQGDLLRTNEGEILTTPFSDALPTSHTLNSDVDVSGGDILGRWTRTFADGSDISVQAYYDQYDRLDLGAHDNLSTTQLDFQHHLTVGSRNDVVWGAGYRFTDDRFTPGYALSFLPGHPTDSLYSTFVQDEIRLTNSLFFTAGSKFEHNAYTGFEYEPSAQLVWSPTSRQTLWASVARAIRQPARQDTDVRLDYSTEPLPGGGVGVLEVTGNPNLKAEQLRDFEAGYRVQTSRRLSLDATGFLNFYRNLIANQVGIPEPGSFDGVPYAIIPLIFENATRARTWGDEFSANWNVSGRWKISPGFSLIRMAVPGNFTAISNTVLQLIDDTSKHQFQVRSNLNLTRRLDWDISAAYVSRLADSGSGPTPAYTRVDTRIGWRLGESIDLSLVGQNLLTPRHLEFPDIDGAHNTLVERAVFGKITWHF
jgi:iron complex outermembrane receptor protein